MGKFDPSRLNALQLTDSHALCRSSSLQPDGVAGKHEVHEPVRSLGRSLSLQPVGQHSTSTVPARTADTQPVIDALQRGLNKNRNSEASLIGEIN